MMAVKKIHNCCYNFKQKLKILIWHNRSFLLISSIYKSKKKLDFNFSIFIRIWILDFLVKFTFFPYFPDFLLQNSRFFRIFRWEVYSWKIFVSIHNWKIKFDFYLAKICCHHSVKWISEWIIMGTIDGEWQELRENFHLGNGFHPLRLTLHAYVPEIRIKCWIELM